MALLPINREVKVKQTRLKQRRVRMAKQIISQSKLRMRKLKLEFRVVFSLRRSEKLTWPSSDASFATPRAIGSRIVQCGRHSRLVSLPPTLLPP